MVRYCPDCGGEMEYHLYNSGYNYTYTWLCKNSCWNGKHKLTVLDILKRNKIRYAHK